MDRNIKLESKRIISQTDIGVVTPYKAQCRQITQSCRVLKFNKITIGTAEIFQGQEKPIMIVSTVRCGTQGLGFVHDKRVRIDGSSKKILLIDVILFLFLFSENERDHHKSKMSFGNRR